MVHSHHFYSCNNLIQLLEITEKMRYLIFFSFLLVLKSWNVSGESAEHEHLKSMLQEFQEKVSAEIDQLRLDFIENLPPKMVCSRN